LAQFDLAGSRNWAAYFAGDFPSRPSYFDEFLAFDALAGAAAPRFWRRSFNAPTDDGLPGCPEGAGSSTCASAPAFRRTTVRGLVSSPRPSRERAPATGVVPTNHRVRRGAPRPPATSGWCGRARRLYSVLVMDHSPAAQGRRATTDDVPGGRPRSNKGA